MLVTCVAMVLPLRQSRRQFNVSNLIQKAHSGEEEVDLMPKQTKEERQQKRREHYENNKELILKGAKNHYEKNKETITLRRKKLLEANKDLVIAKRKKYYSENRLKQIEYGRDYKNKNREVVNQKAREYGKKTNWVAQKKKENKRDRNIRGLTAYHFPIDGQTCAHCSEPATERHHTTKPMQVNKFKYFCHDCHVDEENRLRADKLKLKLNIKLKQTAGGPYA